jgi:hypothetical protein
VQVCSPLRLTLAACFCNNSTRACVLAQGCGLNPRDGLLVEVVAPDVRGTVTRETGKDNVEMLKDVCPELLG